MTQGVLYLATSEETKAQLQHSIRSLEKVGYRGDIHVLDDPKWQEHESRHLKTRMVHLSPFDETIFLDTDIIATKNFDHLFGSCDFGMSLDVHDTLDKILVHNPSSYVCQEELALMRQHYEPHTPHFNSGVVIFNHKQDTWDLCHLWWNQWLRFRGVDQFALIRALKKSKVRVTTLGVELNQPVKFYTGQPETVFLHFWGSIKGFDRAERMNNFLNESTNEKAPITPGVAEALTQSNAGEENRLQAVC